MPNAELRMDAMTEIPEDVLAEAERLLASVDQRPGGMFAKMNLLHLLDEHAAAFIAAAREVKRLVPTCADAVPTAVDQRIYTVFMAQRSNGHIIVSMTLDIEKKTGSAKWKRRGFNVIYFELVRSKSAATERVNGLAKLKDREKIELARNHADRRKRYVANFANVARADIAPSTAQE